MYGVVCLLELDDKPWQEPQASSGKQAPKQSKPATQWPTSKHQRSEIPLTAQRHGGIYEKYWNRADSGPLLRSVSSSKAPMFAMVTSPLEGDLSASERQHRSLYGYQCAIYVVGSLKCELCPCNRGEQLNSAPSSLSTPRTTEASTPKSAQLCPVTVPRISSTSTHYEYCIRQEKTITFCSVMTGQTLIDGVPGHASRESRMRLRGSTPNENKA